MATFEILVELVCIDANQEASSMVKVNMNTNPASTEMESWLGSWAMCKFRIGKFGSRDAWVCTVQIIERIQVFVCR